MNRKRWTRKVGISKPKTQKPKNRLFFSFSFPPFVDELADRLLLVNERSAPDLPTLRALTLLPIGGALCLCCCCCCCGGGMSRVKYRSS